jgi:hypothetical protein
MNHEQRLSCSHEAMRPYTSDGLLPTGPVRLLRRTPHASIKDVNDSDAFEKYGYPLHLEAQSQC